MTSIRDALGRLWDAPDEAPMLQQDGQWFSWGDIRLLSETIDRELAAAEAGPGARVAVVLENRMESVAALITLLRTERTMVTLSPLQPVDRLGEDLRNSAADYLLASRELLENTVFGGVASDSGTTVFVIDGGDVAVYAKASREPRPGDPGVLIEMLTSGTTGPAKRIPLRRKQMEASLSAALAHNNRPEVRDKPPLTGAVGMVILPIVHIGGLWSLLTALLAARPIVMLKRFSIEGWHAAIVEHRPILGGLPPPAIRAVLDSDIPREDLSSLRAMIAGTAPVDPDLVDAFFERFGIPILITYGATEFAGAIAGWTAKDFRTSWAAKKGSVGRAFPGVRLRVVDDAGEVLGAGRTGRLQVASAQVGDSAEKWVTTSDLAHIDADGYLYIDGRADDVIVRGGFKIAPETVVRALRSHEAVADAAVAGLPDQRLGQVPVAAVEVKPGAAAVTGEALREHCRTTLTPYEVPVTVFVVDELPRSAALKVDRRQLISLIEELQQRNQEGHNDGTRTGQGCSGDGCGTRTGP